MRSYTNIAPRPIRIAHLTTVHPTFDTRIFIKECQSLVRAGYEVILVASHNEEETVEGVKIKPLPGTGRRIRRMTLTMWAAFREAWQCEADLYHFHDPELIPIGLLLRASGKRVIYDIHEDVPRDLLVRHYLPGYTKHLISWLIERLENFAGGRFSALVAATPAIQARFQAINPRTIVVNNYPQREELNPPASVAWSGRAQAAAYVGDISTDRGIVQMVEAMGYASERLHITLELAGVFSPPELREQVTKLPGWASVHELGRLSRPAVAQLLGKVQVGLVVYPPTPNLMVGQPVKLFEYMAAGIPVIASNFPLWRGFIEKSGCGLLVDPLDPEAVAEAIVYLVTHPAEAEAMGHRGCQAVEKYYNWTLEETKLLQLYIDLLIKEDNDE